jgi:hypothetical protein
MKVFLGGTCESDWRDAFIPLLDIDYFNPIVENWTEACKVEELKQRQICDFLLYVITPSMKGVYSIAEVTDDSNKKSHRTILVVLKKDDGETFSADETKSLKAVQELVQRNGGQVFNTLKAAADWINEESTAMTYTHSETLDGQQRSFEEVESAFTDVATLESLLDAIEEIRDVGLEAQSAQFVRLQLTSTHKRYGIKVLETSMPSMEAFHTQRTRVMTSISMESVSETIEKVLAWIREKMKQILEMFRQFWHRLSRSLDYVEAESIRVKKSAQTTRWSGQKQVSLSPTVAAKLAVGRTVPEDLRTILSSFHLIEELNHVPQETLDTVYKRVTGQFDWFMQNGGKMPYKAEILVPKGWTEVVHKQAEGRYEVGEMRTFVSPTLPGNVTIHIKAFGLANQEASKDNETNRHISCRPEIVRLDVGSVDTEVRALTSSEVITLCDSILHTVAKMKEARRRIDRHIANVRLDLDQMADRYTRGATQQAQRDYVSIMKNVYYICVVYGTKLTQACESVAFDALTANLSYAKLSIRAIESEVQDRLAVPSLS